MPLRKLSLPEPVFKALCLLKDGGYEAYVVGGCVRDSLMGLPVHDWDITTNALVAEMEAVFRAYRIIATGRAHGTLTVLIGGMALEITTYRIDGAYRDHRRPHAVYFTASLAQDLKRRDFTVNALAYHPDCGIIDEVGGLADLDAGILRTVGNAHERFKEDGLRILRALRFSAVLGFTVDKETAAALHACASLLGYVSAERIRSEFSRMLLSEHEMLISVLDTYRDCLFVFLPELSALVGFEQHNDYHAYDIWHHTLHVIGNTPPRLALRLAALLHDIGKPAAFTLDEAGVGHFYHHAQIGAGMTETILTRLRYNKRTMRQCTQLVRHHRIPITTDRVRLRKLLCRIGPQHIQDQLALVYADYAAKSGRARRALPVIREMEQVCADIISQGDCISLAELAIKGSDLAQLGLRGAQIGAMLDKLLLAVMEQRCKNTPAALLTWVKDQKSR